MAALGFVAGGVCRCCLFFAGIGVAVFMGGGFGVDDEGWRSFRANALPLPLWAPTPLSDSFNAAAAAVLRFRGGGGSGGAFGVVGGVAVVVVAVSLAPPPPLFDITVY